MKRPKTTLFKICFKQPQKCPTLMKEGVYVLMVLTSVRILSTAREEREPGASSAERLHNRLGKTFCFHNIIVFVFTSEEERNFRVQMLKVQGV